MIARAQAAAEPGFTPAPARACDHLIFSLMW